MTHTGGKTPPSGGVALAEKIDNALGDATILTLFRQHRAEIVAALRSSARPAAPVASDDVDQRFRNAHANGDIATMMRLWNEWRGVSASGTTPSRCFWCSQDPRGPNG